MDDFGFLLLAKPLVEGLPFPHELDEMTYGELKDAYRDAFRTILTVARLIDDMLRNDVLDVEAFGRMVDGEEHNEVD